MNSALKIILFMFSLSACAQTTDISPSEKRIFELYSMAALFEFCHDKGIDKRCDEINTKLDTLEPEIYFFQNAEKKEVFVIYTLNNYYPHVMLRYNKDGYIEIIGRGVLFSDSTEFINEFLNSGDFFDDNHAE